MEQNDLIAAIEVLRAKASRVISNVMKIEMLPGAPLARTPRDLMSLEEVRIRLDEIMRFRLEPLLATALHGSTVSDRNTTIRFLESQLAYDQRQLEVAQRVADSIRESMAAYEQPTSNDATAPGPAVKGGEQPKGGEAVMTGRAADAKYRQSLVDDYRKALEETIPHKAAVDYDTSVLNELRKPDAGSAKVNPAAVRAEIDQARVEVGQLINKMNELFQLVSRNMTPSTQLFTITGPPTTSVVRPITAARIVLVGLLAMLVALPLIIILAFLHNRIREEEEAADYVRRERKLASAETLP
jgi:hypothetical protein